MNVSSRGAQSALALILVLAACAGEDGPTQPPPSPPPPPPDPPAAVLALAPGEQSVPAGGAPLTFTATGASGSYTWALSPASGAGILSATSGASVQYTPPTSLGSPMTATLTVTSGAEQATALLHLERRAVQGRVLSIYGDPVPGFMVALAQEGGTFITTTTDAAGGFRFANVPETYDLVLRSNPLPLAVVYHGLTRADPVLTVPDGYGSPAYTGRPNAEVRGLVLGGEPAPAEPARQVTLVSMGVVNPFFMIPTSTTDNTRENTYVLSQVFWDGSFSTTGTLHALQMVKDANSNPTAYTGYGRREGVALWSDTKLSGVDLTLSPISSRTFSATVQPATDTSVSYLSVSLQYDTNASAPLLWRSNGSGVPISTSIAIATPDVPGATLTLSAEGGNGTGTLTVLRTGIALDAAGVTLPVPSVPVLRTPAPGATNIAPGSTFSWSDVPNATHMITLTPRVVSHPWQPEVKLITTGSEIVLPDLSALYITFTPGATYNWDMKSFVPAATVDEFAIPGGGRKIFSRGLTTTAPGYFARLQAYGIENSFTIAP
jgi:hypothetical protein